MSEIETPVETEIENGTETGAETGNETGTSAGSETGTETQTESTNRNQALQEWLAGSPYVTDLYFNFAPAEAGVTGVASVSGERILKAYMGWYVLKAYEFGVIQYKPINTDIPNNSDNADAMHDVELFMNWVKEQNDEKNFPEFEGCTVQRVEVLNNVPMVTGQDDEVARYMYQCRVTYLEKEL